MLAGLWREAGCRGLDRVRLVLPRWFADPYWSYYAD